uniref:Uncharacterized protein n=1 Tax=Chlamydomonas leiostraca TaxID=1034604 RepID=A0A7S0RA86_9CHLO|mmetsp:Transcript_17772/g.44826  ORF Transcript_17772/g.44826 Transcript_17772/m.44826 type:complete len:101 (+) Transcript_17772:474-776(+)
MTGAQVDGRTQGTGTSVSGVGNGIAAGGMQADQNSDSDDSDDYPGDSSMVAKVRKQMAQQQQQQPARRKCAAQRRQRVQVDGGRQGLALPGSSQLLQRHP